MVVGGGQSTKKGGMVDGRVGWCHQSTHPSTTLCVACSATMWSIHQSIPTTHTPHTGDGWDGGGVDEGMRGCVSACKRERERGWWTRREEEKTANGQHQRGGGATPKATATPVLALGVCVACVASVGCVDGVVTNGNHHCGTVAVVVCV